MADMPPIDHQLVFFTVVGNFRSVIADSIYDAGYDADLAELTAKVTFTPLLNKGDAILAVTTTPPTHFVPVPVEAIIDTDGILKLRTELDVDDTDGGYAPIRLLGNCEQLNLATPLMYSVTFSNVRFAGKPGTLTGYTFEAPYEDRVLDLVSVARIPGQPVIGLTMGPPGPPGPPGPATVDVGSTTTSEPGTDAVVTNSGDTSAARFDFVIPRGAPGPVGPAGPTSVRQFPSLAGFPAAGETEAIYIAADTGHTYRWDGSTGKMGAYVGIHEAVLKAPVNRFTGKMELNWYGFTPPYDTTLWIPSLVRNPVLGSQAAYLVHRVEGDAHKEISNSRVHDAFATEVVGTGAYNAGVLNALEASCTVRNAADIELMNSGLFNGGVVAGATGKVGTWRMVFIDTLPPVPAGFTVDELYSLYVRGQSAGQINYSLYVEGGNSVIKGRIVPPGTSAASEVGLRVAARTDSPADQALFVITGPSGNNWWRFNADGTGGQGVADAGATWNISNQYGSKVVLKVQQAGAQTANPFEVVNSVGTLLAGVDAGGAVMTNTVVTRTNNTNQNINLRTYGTGVTTTNSVQVEVKGHKHVAADVTGAAQWVTVPATSTSPGTAGQLAADASFLYCCTATDTWKRIAFDLW